MWCAPNGKKIMNSATTRIVGQILLMERPGIESTYSTTISSKGQINLSISFINKVLQILYQSCQ